MSPARAESMIERVSGLTPRQFKERYRDQARPVVLTDAIEHWPARRLWNPAYLREHFGALPLAVEQLAEDRGGDAQYFLSHVRRYPSTMGAYLEQLQPEQVDGRRYAAMQPLTGPLAELTRDLGTLPYLSEPLRRLSGQKIYLWMGPAGCRAPLHVDPLHNFVVQLFGRKCWTLFPREQQALLYLPSQLSSSHFSPVDVESPQLDRFPRFAEATPIVVDLGPGEVLFVPSGWAHYVRATELSISLNFWWVRPHWRDLARVASNRLLAVLQR